MHRFFLLDTPLQPGRTVDLAPIAHQLRNVLRLNVGVRIVLLDGNGAAYGAEITALERQSASGRVLDVHAASGEPTVHLTLYQSSLKADKFEWVLQKGTELGVSCFVPTLCQRSVVRDAASLAKKESRWQQIIREAAEQSGRGKLPTLAPACSLPEALIQAQTADLILFPWEETSDVELKSVLKDFTPARVALFIGPEGGFTPDEARLAQDHRAKLVSLGPRILRAETAALAASTALLYELGG